MNTEIEKSNGDKTETLPEPTNGNRNPQNAAAEFDWVTERAACSLPRVFSTLRSQIEHDVNRRNSLRPNYAPYQFSIGEDTHAIIVRLEADEIHNSVVFTLADHAIIVRDDQGNRIFDVTVSFDDAGKCRLKVNGEERDFWQVRRMALEDLMFRGR
ncbi:MAG: hypothetical protein WCF22_00200 [Candidatus Sulfotelmatobacter sp.]